MAERESIDLWSTTAATNASVDPSINFAENQLPSTLNNSNRSEMAAIARHKKDNDGSLTSTGSANAYLLTINQTWTAHAAGHTLSFKASFTNTAAVTINVTNADAVALGAKAIRTLGDMALNAGAIVSGGIYVLKYSTTANSSAGAWILINYPQAPLTLAPPTGTLGEGLIVNQTALGTGTNFLGGQAHNLINLSDGVNANSRGLWIYHTIDGTAWRESKHGLMVQAIQTGTPTGGTDNEIVGGLLQASSTVPAGGSIASLFGANMVATLGGTGTGYLGVLGQENDVWISSTASAQYRAGIALNASAASGGDGIGSRGTVTDAGVVVSRSGGKTWGHGLLFTDQHGSYPFDNTSTIIRSTTGTAQKGIDFASVTFTGNAFASNGFTVDGDGNLSANSLNSAFWFVSNTAAPATPSAGTIEVWSDSTHLRLHDKNAAGVIGTTVVADTGASNNFLTAISAAGAISKAQPSFSNLSGSVAATQMPALTGDVTTVAGAVATTLATVNSNVGTFGSATKASVVTVNAKGLVTAASESTVTPAVGSITGLGTGVATALAVNVGTAGSPVVNGGALGSPSSAGTLPAHTLGGTISGGGNQINNVIIGTTTPLAGSFTTLSATGAFTYGGVTLSAAVTGTGNMVLSAGPTLTGTTTIATLALTTVGAHTISGAITYGGVTLTNAVTGTGKMVLDNTPTLVTPVLGAATATSINFGGSTLSTYVAGTWTPTITTSGTVGTPAYTYNVGSYEQIGRLVIARFSIQLSGWTGSPTGNVSIAGLPVASSSTSNDFSGCTFHYYTVAGLAALNYGIVGLISTNSTVVSLNSQSNTSVTPVTAAQAGTVAQFLGTCIYHV